MNSGFMLMLSQLGRSQMFSVSRFFSMVDQGFEMHVVFCLAKSIASGCWVLLWGFRSLTSEFGI